MITFDDEPIMQPMSDDSKAVIDTLSLDELKRAWQTYPIGHHLFVGDTGAFFQRALRTRCILAGDEVMLSELDGAL